MSVYCKLPVLVHGPRRMPLMVLVLLCSCRNNELADADADARLAPPGSGGAKNPPTTLGVGYQREGESERVCAREKRRLTDKPSKRPALLLLGEVYTISDGGGEAAGGVLAVWASVQIELAVVVVSQNVWCSNVFLSTRLTQLGKGFLAQLHTNIPGRKE